MFSKCFWKYFIAEMLISAGCVIAFTAAEKPLPMWLIDIIAVTFAVLYIGERIGVFIKEIKNERNL